MKEINKQAQKNNRVISCLLQLKIAVEDSKFGLSEEALLDIINDKAITFGNIKIDGLMGMASFSSNQTQVKNEFSILKNTFDKLKNQELPINCEMKTLSMGMSGDFQLAIEQGSNMIRVGSAIFGTRNYT